MIWLSKRNSNSKMGIEIWPLRWPNSYINYIDHDNLEATRDFAMTVFYYNDHPDKSFSNPSNPFLAWTSNLSGHEEGIVSLHFSHDGQLLATGSFDNTVLLWDVNSGKEIRRLGNPPNNHAIALSGPLAGVLSVEFSPDDRYLASSYIDTKIRLWRVSTGQLLTVFSGHEEAVLSITFSARW